MAEALQRKLAAIMFTDMVGYSALVQKNEALALELLEEHRRLLRAVFVRHNGREIKTIGDAFLVEFPSAMEAVRCAVEMQKTLVAHNSTIPPNRRTELRVGIHVGDVVYQADDMFGDSVNIASRIAPLAEPGGICLSEDVARQVENKMEAPLEKLGLTKLKNIQTPVDVYRVVLPWEQEAAPAIRAPNDRKLHHGAAEFRTDLTRLKRESESGRTASAPPPKAQRASKAIDSLAILPFTNMSGDPDMEYLSDGITDSLINCLSEMKKLRVAPRSLVVRYKDRDADPQSAGRDLNVRAVLTGRVLLRGETLVIGTELLDVATVSQIWGALYKRKFADIFAIEEEIAREISEKLRVQLSGEEKKRLTRSSTQNKEAYQLYLKALYFWNRWDEEGFRSAVECANQAIAKDPGYAPAHAILANSYAWLGYYNFLPPAEAFPKAKTTALQAIELDGTLSQAHASLAITRLVYDWDWPGAERECRRALELNPNDPVACIVRSLYLLALGRFDEAVAEAKQGVELDPTSSINQAIVGISYVGAHKYEDAIEALKMSCEMAPNSMRLHQHFAFACVLQGRYEEAAAACQKISSLPGGSVRGRAMLGYCYASAGRVEEARSILEELKELPGKDLFVFYNSALLCTALGEFDRAFELLNKLCNERFGPLFYIKQQPMFDPLHSDPRFADMLRRIGVPE